MKLDSGSSLQQTVGWDRRGLRVVRLLAASQALPFAVCSLSTVARRLRRWRNAFPRIQPCHGVGCNGMKEVLSLLSSMNVEFEVANKQQLSQVIDSGLEMDKVLFNNSTKLGSHIRAAAANKLLTTTFDSKEELKKIKKNAPDSSLLLSLNCSSHPVHSQLGSLPGADLSSCLDLLLEANRLGLPVVGVVLEPTVGDQRNSTVGDQSGSDAQQESIWDCVQRQVEVAAKVFDLAEAMGSPMSRLHLNSRVGNLAEDWHGQLAKLLDDTFHPAVKISASAGAFLSSSAVTLAVQVLGVRARDDGSLNYFVNDGVFGSFSSCLTGDTPISAPFPLGGGKNRKGLRSRQFSTVIYGPSGEDLDLITEDIVLPQLSEGDWLLFPNMGSFQAPEMAPLHTGDDLVIYIKARTSFPGVKPCPGLQDALAEACSVVDLDMGREGSDSDLDLDFCSQRGDIDLGSTFIYS